MLDHEFEMKNLKIIIRTDDNTGPIDAFMDVVPLIGEIYEDIEHKLDLRFKRNAPILSRYFKLIK